jgi:hypothetical protein
VNGNDLVVRFGRMGATLQEKKKVFASAEAAKTELDKLIKKKVAEGYADAAWSCDFDSDLCVVEKVDLPLPVPPQCDSTASEWRETFWHGDHVFALDKKGAHYRAAVIDRGGELRLVAPAIEGDSFPFGFDDARDRFIVATSKGPVYVVDCKTARAEQVAPAGAEVIDVALGRDYFAVLRKQSLEITLGGKKHVIACGRENKLFGFGAGRGLMLTWENGDDSWDGKSWPNTFFLGIDKTVRLLGQFGLAYSYGYEMNGKSYFKNDTRGLLEITKLDEALAKTSGAPQPEKLRAD